MRRLLPFKVTQRIISHESNRGQRFNRLLLGIGWQVWKRTIAKPMVVGLSNGYRFVAYPDCEVSSSIIYFRIPNYPEVEFLRQRTNGGLLIDVGSNVGLFTLSLADRLDHAILFEPNHSAARRCKENFAINDLGFEVYTTALSDEVGELFLEDRGGTDSTNRTLKDPALTLFPIRKIPCTTLDVFLKDHREFGRSISVIKIDVEGHENAVIRGAKSTLEELRPNVVMFEYLQRTDFFETQSLFDSVGYHIYSLTGQNTLTRVLGQPRPLQNLFAVPVESRS